MQHRLAVAMFLDQDLVLCQIKTNNGGLLIGSVYCDILVKDFTLIEKAAKHAVKCGTKHILGADSNAWSTLWGDRSNARGLELEETIVSNGLSIENKRGSIPTFEGGMGSSFIDLTLTYEMHDKIKNWSVVRSVDSDHNYICYDVVEDVAMKTKIAWGKTDWKGFRGDLDLVQWNLPPQWTARTIDNLQKEITTQVNTCLEKYAKRVPVSTFRDNNYWQDEQTKVFIKKKMKAFRAYQENPNEDTKQAFKTSRMKLGNRIRKFKRDRYRKALDELTNCSDLSKRLKNLEDRHEINILSSSGEACSPEESVRHLMDKHCPGSRPEAEDVPPRLMKSKVSIEKETTFITYSYCLLYTSPSPRD